MRNILLHFRMFMSRCYFGCLDYPVLILTFIFVLSLVAVFFPRQFTFDASKDTLVAEGDPALEYYREISGKFTSQEYFFYQALVLQESRAWYWAGTLVYFILFNLTKEIKPN